MANRNQGFSQSGSRRQSGQYGSWRDEDRDESNVESREQYGSRDSNEQSGSTGRYAGYGDFGRGEYGGGRSGWSGQERYGQSGYGQGGYQQRGYGQGSNYESDYGQSRYGQGGSESRGYGGPQRGQYGQGNYRSEHGYGGSRGYSEPYGEGQQYSSGGDYAGSGGYGQERGGSGEYGSQGYGSQGYGPRGMGQHRGKGPKGYQRSDERIKELVCERLSDDPQIDPSEVTITVQGGKITLEGTVDSRQTKNAIEEIAEQFGNQDVQNNLRIQRAGQQSSETTGRQSKGTSGDDNTATKQKHN